VYIEIKSKSDELAGASVVNRRLTFVFLKNRLRDESAAQIMDAFKLKGSFFRGRQRHKHRRLLKAIFVTTSVNVPA
jgi:hypothetical protein